MTGQNVLLIVSDEHAREALGCYGADHVHTPNIDGPTHRRLSAYRREPASQPVPMFTRTDAGLTRSLITGKLPDGATV